MFSFLKLLAMWVFNPFHYHTIDFTTTDGTLFIACGEAQSIENLQHMLEAKYVMKKQLEELTTP